MAQNTIEKIEEKIRTNKSLNESDKDTAPESPGSIEARNDETLEWQGRACRECCRIIERSTHEALRQDKNPTLLKLAIDGLSARWKVLKHHIRN